MALQDAGTARAAADAANPMDYDSITMGELNVLITASNGEVILNPSTQGKNGTRKIIQTGGTQIDLLDFVKAVRAKNYDVSYVYDYDKVIIFVRF